MWYRLFSPVSLKDPTGSFTMDSKQLVAVQLTEEGQKGYQSGAYAIDRKDRKEHIYARQQLHEATNIVTILSLAFFQLPYGRKLEHHDKNRAALLRVLPTFKEKPNFVFLYNTILKEKIFREFLFVSLTQ